MPGTFYLLELELSGCQVSREFVVPATIKLNRLHNHDDMQRWVYKTCGYPESQKWPNGVSLETINQNLRVMHQAK